jgi:hypothetical protein
MLIIEEINCVGSKPTNISCSPSDTANSCDFGGNGSNFNKYGHISC